MRIVLTGHKGFIGQHYLKHINDKHIVTTYDLEDGQDLKDSSVVEVSDASLTQVLVAFVIADAIVLFRSFSNYAALKRLPFSEQQLINQPMPKQLKSKTDFLQR